MRIRPWALSRRELRKSRRALIGSLIEIEGSFSVKRDRYDIGFMGFIGSIGFMGSIGFIRAIFSSDSLSVSLSAFSSLGSFRIDSI